jgi:arylsulfatase A-like enzyme
MFKATTCQGLWCVVFSMALNSIAHAQAPAATRPNIVLILSDDVGYGDLGCYGATKVKTPEIDRIAAAGLRFTDAHSTAAICTPSRYSLMTGEYAWRKPGTGVLPGNANLILPTDRPTLPSLLKSSGYATACVGKWHLGLGRGKIDWNGEISPGPLEVGFDESFIIPATGDRVPCVFIEGHRVAGFDPTDPIAVSYGLKVGNEPTGRENPELLTMKPSEGHADTIVNGISRIGFMAGGKTARWKDDQIADTLTARATDFITRHQHQPFFLYFATHDIHVPRVPAQRFRGTSQCGLRGDAIEELDWSVGQVIKTLSDLHLTDNTLVVFSSDNGPVVDDGYADNAERDLNGHTPAGPFRGGKYTLWEGGTRMPFIVYWPGHVRPSTSDALLSQIDLIDCFASLAETIVPPGTASDSLDELSALLGQQPAGRTSLVEQGGGYDIALRKGQWKYIPPGRKRAEPQLYDLKTDPAETKNIATGHVKLVEQLDAELKNLGPTKPGR